MTKKELTDKVGKKFFLDNDYTLAAKLNYDSGIPSFDSYLNGKTLKQISAVIHLTKYHRGVVIKIAKLFSAFPFGLPFSDIQRILLSEKLGTSKLIFETADSSKIIFTLKTADIFEVRQFLDDIHLKYSFETSIADRQSTTETKTVFNLKHRKK